jgi:hypothetical protein
MERDRVFVFFSWLVRQVVDPVGGQIDLIHVRHAVLCSPVNPEPVQAALDSGARLSVHSKASISRFGPIHHHLANRVRAHILLCMLANYVEWHMRQVLAPLLFADEDPQSGEALHPSVVAPAQRSPAARRKIHTHHNENGLPLHSFRTLLQNLATFTRNQFQAAGGSLERTTAPHPGANDARSISSALHRLCNWYSELDNFCSHLSHSINIPSRPKQKTNFALNGGEQREERGNVHGREVSTIQNGRLRTGAPHPFSQRSAGALTKSARQRARITFDL